MRSEPTAVVVMGVSGCGKSSVAASIASAMRWTLIEGDNYHSEENKAKMKGGIALDDADRSAWLASLARELGAHRAGVVMTCSALKRSYRDVFRDAVPEVFFIYLKISEDNARARVQARAGWHSFPASLVASQFEILEDPGGEPGVLTLDAMLAVPDLRLRVLTGIKTSSGA